MAQYVSFEGSQDYIWHMPVLQTTFVASGSITAGNAVGINPSDGTVYALSGVTSSATAARKSRDFIGVATATKADAKKTPVIVWGPVKNVVAQVAVSAGDYLLPSGSGRFAPYTYDQGVGGTGFLHYANDILHSGSIACGRAVSTAAASAKFRALIRGF